MLQNEDIAKIDEIKGKFNKVWLNSEYLQSHLNILGFNKIKKKFNWCKKSGFSFGELISTLLIFPIAGLNNVYDLTRSENRNLSLSKKDAYYRLLGNQNINWRLFLSEFVKQYLTKDELFTTPQSTVKCLVVDDTDLPKTGKTIEGISKIHNHVSMSFYLGFKLLVIGYWNGSVFIPVDFSLHRESKKSKNKYGLIPKHAKAQKNTTRPIKSVAAKRYQELNKKKTDLLIQMFARVVKRKIPVDYILMDTWFSGIELFKKLRSTSIKTHILGMYKYNSKLEIKSKVRTIKQLKNQKLKSKRCRKFNYYYHHYISEIDGLKVVVFISKRGVNGKWHTLISTDTKISFIKAIETYSIRWSIEVFFKEAKQLFGLGKCQSTNFDSQIAQITITMVQYLLTSIRYRIEAYETIGGLFKNLKQDYIENKLNIRILEVINLIITILEKFIDSIDIEEVTRKIITKIEDFGLLKKTYNFDFNRIT